MCLYCRRWDFWIGPTLPADVSALWDEGLGERNMYEHRHHRLLPGPFKGLSSGIRTSGWEGQSRKKREENGRDRELMGLTGSETAKTALFGVRRQEMEGCERCERWRQRRRAGRMIVGKSKCFLICSSVFPAQLQVSQICLILALCA